MLDTFADRQDVLVARDHVVIDLNATPNRKPRIARQSSAGTNTDSHHHDIGGNFLPVLQADALNLAPAQHFRRIGASQDSLATGFQFVFTQPPGRFLMLPYPTSADSRVGHERDRSSDTRR